MGAQTSGSQGIGNSECMYCPLQQRQRADRIKNAKLHQPGRSILQMKIVQAASIATKGSS